MEVTKEQFANLAIIHANAEIFIKACESLEESGFYGKKIELMPKGFIKLKNANKTAKEAYLKIMKVYYSGMDEELQKNHFYITNEVENFLEKITENTEIKE